MDRRPEVAPIADKSWSTDQPEMSVGRAGCLQLGRCMQVDDSKARVEVKEYASRGSPDHPCTR